MSEYRQASSVESPNRGVIRQTVRRPLAAIGRSIRNHPKEIILGAALTFGVPGVVHRVTGVDIGTAVDTAAESVVNSASDLVSGLEAQRKADEAKANAEFQAQVEETQKILIPQGYAEAIALTMADVQKGLTAKMLTQRDLGWDIDPRHEGKIVSVGKNEVTGESLTVRNAVISIDRARYYYLSTSVKYDNGDIESVYVPLPAEQQTVGIKPDLSSKENKLNIITFTPAASPTSDQPK